MSALLHQLTQGASGGLMMGVVTAFFVAVFVGFALWAWSPRNRGLMERAARIPLDDGEEQ